MPNDLHTYAYTITTFRGEARYSKLGGTNDLGSLRVGGSEGRGVLDHYHNVIH